LAQPGRPIQTIGLPRSRLIRLAIATLAALCLHAGAVLLRFDVSGPGHASGARVMAVRLLPFHAIDAAAADGPQVEPADTAHGDREHGETVNKVSVMPVDASNSQTRADLAQRARSPAAAVVESSPRPEPARTSVPVVAAVAAADTALAPAPDYLFGAPLDPGPRPLGDIEPEYPESANLQEGTVVLRLLISETGIVDDVAVVRADPKGVFDDAALEAFRKARFSPGMVLSTPVKSQITVEVHFLPINRGARISGRTY
jgi:TonB family protein